MNENKIDKRISYKMVLDTETCPLDRDTNEVRPDNMFFYDLGWVITDKRGKVYRSRSYVNADIFLDEKELMKSAYYYEKVPRYWEDIKAGTRVLAKFSTIYKVFLADLEEYGVTEIYAHNMRFDYGTLNNTMRWLTKSKKRYFIPYGIKVCDTMKMAQDVICKKPSYKTYCKEHDYMTKNGQVRKTAEILYRYITQDEDFTECHTGLEDVLIEKEIMAYCYRQHKPMRKELWGN